MGTDKKTKEKEELSDLDIGIENITDIDETVEDDEINIDDEFFSGLAKDLEDIGALDESDEEESDEEDEDKSKENETEDPKVDPELEELKKYKDFVPLLEVMMNDPNLVNVVKEYLTGEQTQQSQENFELPEDFIFDFEEAIKDPNSDSGKLLDRYVQSKVRSTVNAELSKEQQQKVLEDQKLRVMKKFGATEQDVNDLINWTKNTQLTLEDAYYLKNRSKIEKEIAKNAINSALKKKSTSHRSLSSKGKPGSQSNPESELFKLIKGSIEFGGGVLD